MTNGESATLPRREGPGTRIGPYTIVRQIGEGGRVVAVPVQVGDWVRKGQVLAVIDRSVQVEQAAGAAAQGGEDEEPAPLLAWADSDTDEGKAPLTVQFTADVEGGKPPLKHLWKFGDGTPDSTEPNPKHTYDKPGQYRADLEVNDSAGDSDSDYLEIDVQQ